MGKMCQNLSYCYPSFFLQVIFRAHAFNLESEAEKEIVNRTR